MKKYTPYILALLMTGAIAVLLITGNNKKERQLDERVTLRNQDKIPYGTYVAYNALKHIFPKAVVYNNKYEHLTHVSWLSRLYRFTHSGR